MGRFSDLVEDDAAPRANLALQFGVQASPDEAAESAQLARRYKLPTAVVSEFREDYRAKAKADDAKAAIEGSPQLKRWLSYDQQNAQIAHDDVQILSGIEMALRTLKNVPSAIVSAFPRASGGLWGLAAAPFEVIGQGMQGVENAARDMLGLQRFEGDQPGAIVGGVLRGYQRNADRMSADLYTAPADAGIIERGVGSGVQSTAQNLLTLPLALRQGGEKVALGIMGAITGGQSYGKARDADVSPAGSLVFGAEDAAAEIITEALPLAKLVGDIKAGSTAGRMLVNNIVLEIPGELAATTWQSFNEWLTLNPDKSVGEWADELPAQLAETIVATIVGSGSQTGAVKGVQTVLDRFGGEDARAKQAERTAAQAEALAKLGEASALRGRDAATFNDFVAQVAEEGGDAPTEFYIDGATLANSLNQSGVTMAELEAIAPVVAGQLEAAATGGDVRVPVSEFMAAGEAVTAPLVDHLRASPDAMSRAEAQQFMKEQGDRIKKDVERELEQIDERAGFQQSIDAVRQEFQAELDRAGRFTGNVNKAYADLLANFYGAQAARLGMQPQELLQRYRLNVRADLGQGARTLNQGGDSLDKVRAEWNDAGVRHSMTEANGTIELNQIVVEPDAREQGIGTAAMRRLLAYADATGQRIVLTPSSDFGGEKARLTRFYKGFGFKDNKGRSRDFTTRATMIREPAVGTERGRILDQGETPRAQIALPESFDASPAVISLLAGADLSSFLHESGHLFLEIQADLAQRIQQQIDSGASVTELERGIVADMDRLLAWFGVKGSESLTPLQEWADMTLDQKRESHEQFARGFEAYAMEGKAPSIALQDAFQRFRSWLLQVYKTLRGLNVELTEDVRAVMGRMLASDFAIEEAEAQRNMGPLFKDAESAGMTLDEFNAYQATARSATEQAIAELQTRGMKDMRWLSRAKDKALKARQQEVEELRRDVRQEVRSEVYSEPVYRAWQFLTGKLDQVTPGDQAAEDVDLSVQAGRLRTQVLRDMYGTDETAVWRKLSARRMTSDETGMHPEIVAEMFGFDSADAMVTAIADATPPAEVIEARTDQRMLEMFGDITSEAALNRAADEAVHNEARARFIASELKALQAANTVREKRGKSSVDVMARAAKDYAQQIIARLKVRELRPSQYAAAEARNARLAEKALASGKTEEAAMHKRNQLVNNYATKATYEAQAEVKSAQDYFKRFDKRSKAVDAGYLDQIEGLLERFDFKPASLKEIDRRKSFAAWYAEQKAAGNEPVVPDDLLDEANRKSFKDMTLEEIRGLRETIEQIEHLGRLKNKLLLARDQRTFDSIATEVADSIVEHGGKTRPVELEGAKGFKPWLEGLAAAHRKLSSLFRQMDGGKDGGPLYEHIGRAMNERGTMEDVMVEKATVALAKLYEPILKLKGGVAGYRSKVFIPEINASLTRGGRLAVALNWGNEQNRQRLRDGDKWNDAQVRAILKTLSTTELEFVNGVWAYIDSYWSEIAAKEKRLTGVEPEKVEGSPFLVTASDGTEVQMRGGYYPLKYDTDQSDRAEQQEAAQVAKEMMQGAFTRATTRRGHTKARLEEVKRAVRKDLNVITQHVTQVVHDLAWHEWLIDTNKLLGDDRIVQAVRDHYGPKALKTIRDDVMGIATADVVPQTDIDKALLLLRGNVTRATMGASLTTAFLQPFGLTQSMVRIGPKHVLRGLARWGGDAARMESTVGWIREKSEFMRLRTKTFNRELREISGAVGGKSKTMRVVDAGLFALMQKMQMVADVPTWVGQYEKSLAEGLDEDAAIGMADRAVIESQGGSHVKDLAEVQRKHPMLTQFYSYFSVTLNLTAERTAATDFKDPAAVAGWLGDMALLLIIPAILPSMLLYGLKGGGADDDEEAMAKKIAQWQLGYLLGMVVGARELSGAVSGFDYAGPPVGRVIADIGKAGKQTAQGEVDEPAVMAYINLLGTAFGIPTIQATRSYKGWKAWSEGEEGAGPLSVLFGPPPKE